MTEDLKTAKFVCKDCEDIGTRCELTAINDDVSRPQFCPYSVIEGNKTPWKKVKI